MNTDVSTDFPDETDMMILPWVTLFPGALLPLYIFEERYRKMTKSSLAGNRMFAIAHLSDDSEISSLGSLGIIRACVTNEDGTSNLVLQGISRVEFSKPKEKPRPHACIRIIFDKENSSHLTVLRNKILRKCEILLKNGFDAHACFTDYLHSSVSHSAFTDLVSSTLIPDPVQRRTLFETLDLELRMALLLELLPEKSD